MIRTRSRRLLARRSASAGGATAMISRLRAEFEGIGPRMLGTLGASGVVAVLGLTSGAIAARDLGPASRGELAQLLLWPQLFCTIGNLGIDLAATYLSADPARRARVPATMAAIAIAQSIVLVPLYLLTMPLVLDGATLTHHAMLMSALIPLYLLGSYCAGALSGWLNFRAFNSVRIATPLIYTACIAALAYAQALTPGAAAAAYLVANGAADVLAMALLWRRAGTARPDIALAKDAAHYGLRAHAGRLSPQALGVDVIVVALFLSTQDLGLFVAAAAFLAAPRLLTASIGMVAFAHVSTSHQAGERPKLGGMFALYGAAAVLPSLALLLFARPMIGLLFGADYAGAATVLRLLAVSSLALSLRAFPLEVLRGLGRPGLTSVAEVAGSVLFFASIGIGGAARGLEGVAAGVAVASTLSLLVTCVLAQRSGVFVAPGTRGAKLEAAA